MATRWGVAGCGKISSDFVNSWRSNEKHVLVAAAARSLSNAQEFVRKNDGKTSYGSYQELAKDPDIEVVYVGTIHPFHLDVVRLMLANGKHVLCEKPLGMNVEETRTMIQYAKSKGLFLMEAIWSRCLPVYREAKRRLESGEIGEPQYVTVSFGEYIGSDRIREKKLGGGATLDIGIYCIQFALLAFDGNMPDKIVATGSLNEEGVDQSVSVSLTFPSGKMANLSYTCLCKLNNVAIIAGSKGTIKVDAPFWCSENLTSSSGGEFASVLPSIAGSQFNFTNSQGLMYEADEVRNCLKNGLQESPLVPHDLTLKVAQIMQSIHQQLGVDY